jgi:NTP pyrophosphatase (non-canonical NTP hydrolase)
MNFNEYQSQTQKTAFGYATSETENVSQKEAIQFLALALNGESGEVAEKAKKYIREDDEMYVDGLRDELGDVLWYLTRLAVECDIDIEKVAQENVNKLTDRDNRDMITGMGDDR